MNYNILSHSELENLAKKDRPKSVMVAGQEIFFFYIDKRYDSKQLAGIFNIRFKNVFNTENNILYGELPEIFYFARNHTGLIYFYFIKSVLHFRICDKDIKYIKEPPYEKLVESHLWELSLVNLMKLDITDPLNKMQDLSIYFTYKEHIIDPRYSSKKELVDLKSTWDKFIAKYVKSFIKGRLNKVKNLQNIKKDVRVNLQIGKFIFTF